MKTDSFDVKKLVKDKKFWFASFLIVWAAGLQGHMMWMKRQDSFKEKFVDQNQVQKSQEMGKWAKALGYVSFQDSLKALPEMNLVTTIVAEMNLVTAIVAVDLTGAWRIM